MHYLSSIALVGFVACAGLVVYTYAGYPLLIWLLARVLGRRGDPRVPGDADLPTMSLVIAAYNEEPVIQQRILNALELDYPAGKLEIVIATDGCSDRTAEVVRRYQKHGVRLLDYAERRGKATVLNDSIPRVRGEVVILSDAN